MPLHTDSPYFYGASRKQYPEWLLACMVFSRLFQDKFINQVQVVGYLHDWVPQPDEFDKTYNASDPTSMVTSSDGGDFVYYDKQDENPKVIVPYPRSGSFIDGSKAIHAAKVYRKGVQAPFLDKSKNNTLVYQGKYPNGTETELWHLVVDGETTAVYKSEDVRMTIVYRARCFAKQEDVQRFYAQTDKDVMPLDYILDRLKYGMQKDRENVPEAIRNINPVSTTRKYTRAELDAMSRYTLGLALIDYYLPLPLPPTTITWMPYNYCALSGLYPFTKPLLDLIC
ncbi:hypothetical protein EON65_00585 [archaeon]|nr:MAG: hypothetical protein EON65_00585 [archaeon]